MDLTTNEYVLITLLTIAVILTIIAGVLVNKHTNKK